MNKKALGVIIGLIVIVGGSYFATNATLKGSVFEETKKPTDNLEEVKQLANEEETPADYAFTKLTVYLPSELAGAGKNANPDEDSTINNEGISQGNVSSGYSSNKNGSYLVRGIIKNLGTTTAPLPKVEVSVNETNISKVSGLVKFSKITKDGMEVIISIPKDASYLKQQNTLTVTLDKENKVEETKEDNNSASVGF